MRLVCDVAGVSRTVLLVLVCVPLKFDVLLIWTVVPSAVSVWLVWNERIRCMIVLGVIEVSVLIMLCSIELALTEANRLVLLISISAVLGVSVLSSVCTSVRLITEVLLMMIMLVGNGLFGLRAKLLSVLCVLSR